MYGDMSEWNLEELQNRVRENLASTIHDVRKVFLNLESGQFQYRKYVLECGPGNFREFATGYRWNML
jgi:hypothetical protein